jgi:hypothetical protein
MRPARTILPTVLAVALAVGLSGMVQAASPSPATDPTSSASATGESATAGFATPEDAVREYLAGVAEADVSRILGASAVDEASAGFAFPSFIDRLKAFPPGSSLGPSDYPFYADINRAELTQRILRKVQMLAFGLLSGEEFDGGIIAPADRAWAEAFVGKVDPSRLAGLTVEDIRFSVAGLQDDARFLDTMAKMAAVYGADDLTERLVLFSLDDQLYDLGFTVARYGDGWKVFDQAAPLGGTNPMGTARPTTVEEYQQRTSAEG